MIQFCNVSFTYSGERSDAGVYGIQLAIQKGEVVLLSGASGCGKTTLTRLINGLIPHYYEGTLTGAVMVCGHEIASTPLYETAQMDVSVDASWNHLFCDFQICTNGGVGYIFPKLQPLFGNLGKDLNILKHFL